ncbi:hypothetical protein CRUP_005461 [Coryphaenoides rupestris]|nr:hypothetical protein CRUP_005461 [Coryphaenoides rupestris]
MMTTMSDPDDIARLYRELSLFPALSRADVGPVITSQYGGQYSNVYTEWSQRDLERNESVKFCRQYVVFHDGKSVVYSGPSGNCTEIKGELLSKDSPSGEMKAVVRECSVKGEEKQFLEIWIKNIKAKSIDLTALKKHGKVYGDEQFGCLVWSHSETHLLYVAERKRPKAESFFQTESPESSSLGDEDEMGTKMERKEKTKGEQFIFYEDWGEALVGKSCPVLCVLDIEGSNVSVLEGVPEDISPGQAFWAPGDTGVVFVGWCHEPFRLGLRYSPNRRAVVVWRQCDGFTGIYSSQLSPQCWSADSQRVLIACPQRSRQDLLVVDVTTGGITSLTAKSDVGNWCLLNIERDLMVVSCSSPNRPPSLRVGFLPAKDSQVAMAWVTLEDSQPLHDIDWQVLTFFPPADQDNDQYPGLDFEALLIKPKEVQEGRKLPLVVTPHGGPHSVIVAEWLLSSSVLCRMGFAVLLVNYRGSIGYGQDSILSLPGNVGSQDVQDVHFAVTSVLNGEEFDGQKVAVSGGSHGGFLACHLIGQYQGFYQACVAYNLVTNMASMIGSTDIPDWCLVESGYDYSADSLPDPAVWEQMLSKSPIKHIAKVKTPVLLLLGEEDKRVPNKQGIEYYRALKARQVPVQLLWYPGKQPLALQSGCGVGRFHEGGPVAGAAPGRVKRHYTSTGTKSAGIGLMVSGYTGGQIRLLCFSGCG